MPELNLHEIIDIILVALLLYGTYKVMKSLGAFSVFMGAVAIVVIWLFVSYVFQFRLLGAIMNKVISVGVIALIVIFQNEIRRFLVVLGSRKGWGNLYNLFKSGKSASEENNSFVMQIVLACRTLSKKKVGALIVIEKNVILDEYIRSGERIDANINNLLLQNIFFKNSPLHDGAVIISGGKIKAASCILPVAHNDDLPKSFGLRHRAAIGISQYSDCLAVVVSEETGAICVASGGHYENKVSIESLELILSEKEKK